MSIGASCSCSFDFTELGRMWPRSKERSLRPVSPTSLLMAYVLPKLQPVRCHCRCRASGFALAKMEDFIHQRPVQCGEERPGPQVRAPACPWT